MKSHTIKFKQDNMLCHRCLLNVAEGLSKIGHICELNIDLDTKIIEVMYNDKLIIIEEIKQIVDDSIKNGVRRKASVHHSI